MQGREVLLFARLRPIGAFVKMGALHEWGGPAPLYCGRCVNEVTVVRASWDIHGDRPCLIGLLVHKQGAREWMLACSRWRAWVGVA